ncbi:MAG: CBS domain-containing protein [Pseudomonadota bacterium]
MPYVRDLLNIKSKEIHKISPDETVYDALKLMSEKEIGALIVTNSLPEGFLREINVFE